MNFIQKYKYKKEMQNDKTNLSDELVEILKRDLNDPTLECFRFSDFKQMHEIILNNYRNVNNDTLELTVCKIMLMHFEDNFRKYKEHEEKADLRELVKELEKEG